VQRCLRGSNASSSLRVAHNTPPEDAFGRCRVHEQRENRRPSAKRVGAIDGGTGGCPASPEVQNDGEAPGAVLMTGATGFIGMELLARYLERTDRRVYALVRGADAHEVAAGVERTLRCLFGPGHPYAESVVAVRGDITRSGLGLGGRGGVLAGEVSEIVHGAASVSFELGLVASRAVNVKGTRLGCPLDATYPIVPLAESHAVSVGMTTVNGHACFGVYADCEGLPDVDMIGRDIDDALTELVACTHRTNQRRDRGRARRHAWTGEGGLAARPEPRDAADPRHELGRAARGQHAATELDLAPDELARPDQARPDG
jgi:Male sterility protein/WS/DGAT C-terminal domain